jgi:HNH endonuclease
MHSLSLFDMPSRGSIRGRSSSITAAFFQVLTPQMIPTTEDVDAVLRILGMRNGQCVCAYCGDPKTEWDHFRSIVDKQKPTGYITEIANLVPACGKCNQSKGSKHWKTWMLGPAKRSPATRGIPDLQERVARLEAFESWRKPVKLDYPSILGAAKWQEYMKHWDSLLDAMKTAQAEAEQLRALVESHLNVV